LVRHALLCLLHLFVLNDTPHWHVSTLSLHDALPISRLMTSGEERLLLLEEVEALLASNAFVVDACRHVVRDSRKTVSLARRPVLDRKSTRLNSSHGSISYAVFCLKKNK